jgi:hypothetical protein
VPYSNLADTRTKLLRFVQWLLCRKSPSFRGPPPS